MSDRLPPFYTTTFPERDGDEGCYASTDGRDMRWKVTGENFKEAPYARIVRVVSIFELENEQVEGNQGTAFLVETDLPEWEDYLVYVTAAHVLYMTTRQPGQPPAIKASRVHVYSGMAKSNEDIDEQIARVQARDPAVPFVQGSSYFSVNPEYLAHYTAPDDSRLAHDIGIIAIRKSLVFPCFAKCGGFSLQPTVASTGYKYDSVKVSGYPLKVEIPGAPVCTANIQMYEHGGLIERTATEPTIWQYKSIDTSPGQSGAPLWIKNPGDNQYYVLGVHNYDQKRKKRNQAVLLTRENLSVVLQSIRAH